MILITAPARACWTRCPGSAKHCQTHEAETAAQQSDQIKRPVRRQHSLPTDRRSARDAEAHSTRSDCEECVRGRAYSATNKQTVWLANDYVILLAFVGATHRPLEPLWRAHSRFERKRFSKRGQECDESCLLLTLLKQPLAILLDAQVFLLEGMWCFLHMLRVSENVQFSICFVVSVVP